MFKQLLQMGILVTLAGCALRTTNRDIANYASMYYPPKGGVVTVNSQTFKWQVKNPKPAWKVLTFEEIDELTRLLDERDKHRKEGIGKFMEMVNELNALIQEMSTWKDYQRDLEAFKAGTLDDRKKAEGFRRLMEINKELVLVTSRNHRIDELFWSSQE